MFETMEKMMMAGLGAICMTREKAEKLFDEYAARGQELKKNKEGFVAEMLEFAEKNRNELESMIGRQLKKTMANLELPSKADLERLEKKLDKALSKLDAEAK